MGMPREARLFVFHRGICRAAVRGAALSERERASACTTRMCHVPFPPPFEFRGRQAVSVAWWTTGKAAGVGGKWWRGDACEVGWAASRAVRV